MNTRKYIIASSGLLLSSMAIGQKLPNIIIILADDMGYGDVRCNNPYGRTQTPAIDQLANQGIRFTDAHSAGALSGPSRYGLVTGRYFFRETKQKEYWGYLKPYIQPNRLTIGSLMKQAGYNTACIGKWHLGLNWALKDSSKSQIITPDHLDYTNTDFHKPIKNGPSDLGFDYSFILPASLDMPPYVFVKNNQVIDPKVILTKNAYPASKPKTIYAWDRKHTGEEDIYWERGVWWRNGEMSESFKFEECLPTIINEGITYIEQAGKQQQPFLLYLPLTGPHTPWLPEEPFKGSTRLGTYGDFIRNIDHAVERITSKLKELGIADNTIVIFTSDNGGAWEEIDIQQYAHQSNYGRRGQKGDAWDGGHHVPFIISWPRHIQPAICHQTISLVDIFATLAEIAGLKLPGGQAEDSFSFKKILDGDNRFQSRDHILYLSGSGQLAIKQGDWKYIDCLGSGGFTAPTKVDTMPNGPTGQLYRIDKDSLEINNLFLLNKEKARELSALLKQFVEQGHSRKY